MSILATPEDGLEGAIRSARSEALNAFGSDELILERAVIGGRHIEIQVAADASGQLVCDKRSL
jgi:geranyl-CoA carboxylase alpha subunit